MARSVAISLVQGVRSPQFLTEIVYRMRFDEASARYAEFGPFYASYVMTPAEMLDHCRIGAAS